VTTPRFNVPDLSPEPPAGAPAPVFAGQAEDAALLHAVAVGDTDALARLYRRRGGLLFALLARVLENDAEAEDALQETFVQIWRRAADFSPLRAAPLTWMVMIARGLALDRRRARRRRGARLAAYGAEVASLEVMTHEGHAPAADAEAARAVEAALQRLPDEQRHALQLAFFRGWTHEAIARATGQPLGTVKSRIRRGLAALRQHLRRLHA
jgi:RNA polymerase sigma-70 factor (ECF subfamily)